METDKRGGRADVSKTARRFREAPVKFCYECFMVMHSATKQCPYCGMPATEKGRQAWREGL